MSFVDVLIPLIAGLALVSCPQVFFKATGSTEEDILRKKGKLRKLGWVLLGVAVLYFFLTLARPS